MNRQLSLFEGQHDSWGKIKQLIYSSEINKELALQLAISEKMPAIKVFREALLYSLVNSQSTYVDNFSRGIHDTDGFVVCRVDFNGIEWRVIDTEDEFYITAHSLSTEKELVKELLYYWDGEAFNPKKLKRHVEGFINQKSTVITHLLKGK